MTSIDPIEQRKQFVETQLVNEFSKPIVWLDWWTPISRAINTLDPEEALRFWAFCINTKRQQGKSLFGGCDFCYDLFHTRGFQGLLVAASEVQAQRIFEQKFVIPIQANKSLRHDAKIGKGEIRVKRLGSLIEVVPANRATITGRSLSKLMIDEAREIPDDLFGALVPSVIATKGKVIIVSTAGRPSGFFYEMVTKPGPSVYVYRTTETINPMCNEKALQGVAAELKAILPQLHAREFGNQFVGIGNEAFQDHELDAVIDPHMSPLTFSDETGAGMIDLGTVRDLISISGVEPAGEDRLRQTILKSYNPKDYYRVSDLLETAQREVKLLADRFPNYEWHIDVRHEGHGFIAAMEKQGVYLHQFAATAQTNMQLWSRLFELVRTGKIRLLDDKRLRDELLSLRVQDFSFGQAFRVLDGDRKLHRDLSMSTAAAAFFASEMMGECPVDISYIDTPSDVRALVHRRVMDSPYFNQPTERINPFGRDRDE